MNDTVSLEFLAAFAEAWNRHDAQAIVAMMTPDCVMCLSAGPTREGSRYEGRDAVRAAAEAMFARFADAAWLDARHFISANRGVSEWTFRATGADGTQIETHGCDIFRFRDGLISVKDSYRKQVV